PIISRFFRKRDGSLATSTVPRTVCTGDSAADFDLSWLRSATAPPSPSGTPLRAVDLFAGCGAMSLGTREGARALERPVEFTFAAELDPVKAGVYARNFPNADIQTGPVELFLDGDLNAAVTQNERDLV